MNNPNKAKISWIWNFLAGNCFWDQTKTFLHEHKIFFPANFWRKKSRFHVFHTFSQSAWKWQKNVVAYRNFRIFFDKQHHSKHNIVPFLSVLGTWWKCLWKNAVIIISLWNLPGQLFCVDTKTNFSPWNLICMNFLLKLVSSSLVNVLTENPVGKVKR